MSLGEVSSAPVLASKGEREIYGVFAGISKYPADGPGDLRYTADDAERLYNSLPNIGMQKENAALLQDDDATIERFKSEVARLGAQMSEEDIMVIFFSGHGSNQDRADKPRDDPDGLDETIVLYDGELLDDEMDQLISESTKGTVLIVLDACLSGGFAKDLVSAPNRMGLFSSEEDVLSDVALKFEAGGYLSQFFADAVGERLADANDDRAITAMELQHYIGERYRTDVLEDDKKQAKKTPEPFNFGGDLSYQRLVVDKSIHWSEVLFSW